MALCFYASRHGALLEACNAPHPLLLMGAPGHPATPIRLLQLIWSECWRLTDDSWCLVLFIRKKQLPSAAVVGAPHLDRRWEQAFKLDYALQFTWFEMREWEMAPRVPPINPPTNLLFLSDWSWNSIANLSVTVDWWVEEIFVCSAAFSLYVSPPRARDVLKRLRLIALAWVEQSNGDRRLCFHLEYRADLAMRHQRWQIASRSD